MEFKSETNRPTPHEYAQNNFSKYIEVYEDLINKRSGKIETTVTDREDFYEKIQSHKDSQLLESIIKRYEIDIDKKQVKEIEQDIVDMTAIPQTITEAYSMIKQIENDFDERPSQIKKIFNNNIGEYIAGIQDGRLKQALDKYQNKTPNDDTEKKEEIKKDNQVIVNQETISEIVKQQIAQTLGDKKDV